MKTELLDSDLIVDHALNYGIKSAEIRFGLSKDIVKNIINTFKDSVLIEAGICEEERKNGIVSFCESCSKHNSFSLTERINKL